MLSTAVHDSFIAYSDSGSGPPFVFLHGNPTSSYLWRHVLPALDLPARVLAPDLIGMGHSGKPESDYSFADHARYLDAWFDALALDGVVLVGHDWGGALAFDWAARHARRVRGVAFLETIVRPLTWADFGAGRPRIEALRTPGVGEKRVLEENFFITTALRATTERGLSDADLAVYAAPYPTPASRRPLLAWPRAFPIEGQPADVVERVEAYGQWLARSPEVPKLLLTFDGSPETLLIGAAEVAWCAEHMVSLDVAPCGPARHLAVEDQPQAIAAALNAWARRVGLLPLTMRASG